MLSILGSVGDDIGLLRKKSLITLNYVDVFVTTGGVSTGQEDFVSQLLKSEGQLINWRIAIKPGRPFICAKLGAKYVFGLPGNPVAAFICALIILRPSLGRLEEKKNGLSLSLSSQKQILKSIREPVEQSFYALI